MAKKTRPAPTTERVTARPTTDFYDTRAGVKRRAGRQFLTSKQYAESLGEKVYDVKPWGGGEEFMQEANSTPAPENKTATNGKTK